MKCSKRSFTIVSALFAVLLSSSTGTLNARDADLASRTFAAAQTAKQQCINTCRARHRSCVSSKQIPSIECRGIYQAKHGPTSGRHVEPYGTAFVMASKPNVLTDQCQAAVSEVRPPQLVRQNSTVNTP